VANLDGTDIAQGERLLAQRSGGWKLACSIWVLMVGVGFVFFSVLGWIVGSLLSRSRKMWIYTVVWGALFAFALLAMERWDDTDSDLGVVIFIAIWMGSVAHAAYLSRGVLRARAVAQAKDQGWQPSYELTSSQAATPATPPAPPQPDMPTIPLPDGVSPQQRGLRDS
jgi:thiol:disulfide interchange protein